eukprot:Em0008g556a
MYCPGDNISGNDSCSYVSDRGGSTARAISVVAIFSSLLSCMGSVLIVYVYLRWPAIRSGSRAIITYLAIADFVTGFGYIMGSSNYLQYTSYGNVTAMPASTKVELCNNLFTPVCKIQSFLTTSSSMMSFLWTLILAIYLHMTVVKNRVRLVQQLVAPVSRDRLGLAYRRDLRHAGHGRAGIRPRGLGQLVLHRRDPGHHCTYRNDHVSGCAFKKMMPRTAAAHHQKSWDSLRLFSMADTLLKNTTDELNRARLLAASYTYAPSYSTIAAQQAGAVGQQTEDKKAQKYKHLSSHHFFTPVAIETSGVYGPRTANFLKELGHRLRQVSGEASSFHYLAQRLSVAIQRGNQLQ